MYSLTQRLQEKFFKLMSEQVISHITETLKMMFAAYQISDLSTTPEAPLANPIISQPRVPAYDEEEDIEEEDSRGRIRPQTTLPLLPHTRG